jgi:hypothetical protein
MSKVDFVLNLSTILRLFLMIDFYAAQRQLAAQRAQQQQEEEFSQPVGIRVDVHINCLLSFTSIIFRVL